MRVPWGCSAIVAARAEGCRRRGALGGTQESRRGGGKGRRVRVDSVLIVVRMRCDAMGVAAQSLAGQSRAGRTTSYVFACWLDTIR